MSRPSILDPNESYTFRKYFELPFSQEDILAEFGVSLKREALQFNYTPLDYSALKQELELDLTYIDLESEAARREVLIAPVLKTLCRATHSKLKIEYPVAVSSLLRGNLDYLVQSTHKIVVVEAKNADLMRGFTQLAIELIAMHQWLNSEVPILYGAVTTGEEWRFGRYDSQEKVITRDLNLYTVPSELNQLIGILTSLL